MYNKHILSLNILGLGVRLRGNDTLHVAGPTVT